MEANLSDFSGCGLRTVENVSWYDVQVFIGRLNAGEAVKRYRFPTEAEWEYVAREETTGIFAPRTST